MVEQLFRPLAKPVFVLLDDELHDVHEFHLPRLQGLEAVGLDPFPAGAAGGQHGLDDETCGLGLADEAFHDLLVFRADAFELVLAARGQQRIAAAEVVGGRITFTPASSSRRTVAMPMER